MNYRFYFFSFLLLTGLSPVLKAQTNFYLSGLGRAVVTNDKLTGNILENDSLSARRGAGGYTLFDLKANLDVNKNFQGNAILRVRNEFGSFWGLGTTLTFRQLQLTGTIEDVVKYEIGDINVGMTPYTVYNPEEIYHAYEADIYKIRRDILEYENFIFGNQWRLQGLQLSTTYLFKKGIEKIGVKGFGVRTNPTNETSVPDRVLAGFNINAVQSKFFELGVNYVGMLDIPIQTSPVNYQNQVFTGTTKINLDKEKVKVQLSGETGFSDYKYQDESTKQGASSYNDFFYDVSLNGTYKPLGITLTASYKDVGPQFTSPAAQTRRINVATTPLLFDKVLNNSDSRQQLLFDRFTQEGIYNRSISPVLQSFLPQYNNITPYGPATPNRRGFTFGLSKGSPANVLSAELIASMQKEIVGMGTSDLRNFLGIRGGLAFNIGKLLEFEKLLMVTAGARTENTTRGGSSSINLNSTLIDAGLTWELVKKLDLLVGMKTLNAKGNEDLYTRDVFNTPQTALPVLLKLNVQENIYSAGGRLRFSERTFFTLNYNLCELKDKDNNSASYSIHQVFANYTIKF